MNVRLAMSPSVRENARPVAVAALAGALLAGSYALLAPSWYTARLSVVSLKRSPSRALSQQAGELAELGAFLPGLGSGDAERVAAVLSSDSVANAVVQKFDLQHRYGEKHPELAVEELWKHCRVRVVPKGELVILTCEDKEPATAQAMVAYFGEHGNAVFRRVDASSAGEEVRFLEAHLAEIRAQGREAQQRLRAFEEENKIVDLESQAKAVVSTIASLRSQRVSKEIELSYAKGFAARGESSTMQLQRMLSVLEAKARALEEGPRERGSLEGDLFPPAVVVPRLKARLQELQLDRKFYETAELLAMQGLEAAKAKQAREVSTFQVLDAPTLPTYRSRPRRLLLVALGALAGLVLGLAWVFGPAYVRSLRSAP